MFALWKFSHNTNWLKYDNAAIRFNSLAFTAFGFGILWGIVVLSWWDVPKSFFWGFIVAYLIYLWIPDKYFLAVMLISNTFVIGTCILLYAFYFGLIDAGPHSNYFGVERKAVFVPGRLPNIPPIDDFRRFGDALGRASACGLAQSEMVVALRDMNGGLAKTLDAGGITEIGHDDLRGAMVDQMTKARRAQAWYFDKVSCGEALSRWRKIKKITPL